MILDNTSIRSENRVDVLGVTGNARADLGRGGWLSAGLDGYFEWVASSANRATVSGGPYTTASHVRQCQLV